MEYFDVFNSEGVFISSEDEQDVHFKGLWHKVIRIWLFDNDGNLWLRRDKSTNKLDTLGFVHLRSDESIINCCDRLLFGSIGMHLPSSSNIVSAGNKKVSYEKKYTNDVEFKENYFLNDYVANFDGENKFFMFNDETASIVKCNVNGILNLLSAKAQEVIGFEYNKKDASFNKIIVRYDDILKDNMEDNFSKYQPVLNLIVSLMREINSQKTSEDENEFSQEETTVKLHADENDGTEVY